MAQVKLQPISKSLAKTYGILTFQTQPPFFCGSSPNGNDYICPKCSEVIATGLDDFPPVENGATSCPKCKIFLHLRKKLNYDEIPSFFSDLPKNHNYYPIKNLNPLWQTDDDIGRKLAYLSNDFTGKWIPTQTPLPGVLYHYTDLTAFLEIMKSNVLWASDISYLNDATELDFANKKILGFVNSKLKHAFEVDAELLRRSFSNTNQTDASQFFGAISFCEQDDLLSQWRGYAGSIGGVSIGFDSSKLATNASLLRKLVYKDSDQAFLANYILDKTVSLVRRDYGNSSVDELDRNKILPLVSTFLSDYLNILVECFKNPAFSEEQEWRLVFPLARHLHLSGVKFRKSSDRIIPYIEFSRKNSSGTAEPSLPIVSLTIGPNNSPALNEKSLHLILEKYGYEHVEVRLSKTQLRS